MNDYLARQARQVDRAKTFAGIRRIEDCAGKMAQAAPEARRSSGWLPRALGRRPRAAGELAGPRMETGPARERGLLAGVTSGAARTIRDVAAEHGSIVGSRVEIGYERRGDPAGGRPCSCTVSRTTPAASMRSPA